MAGEPARPSIGILAVQAGVITQQQMMECLDLQRGEDRPLEEILIAKGYLTREKVEQMQRQWDSAVRKRAAVPAESAAAKSPTKVKTRGPNQGTSARVPAPPSVRQTSSRIKVPDGVNRGTSVRTKSPSGLSPAPQRGTRVRENTQVRKERFRLRAWIAGGICALVPLAALLAFVLFDAGKTKAPPPPGPVTPPVVTEKPPPEPAKHVPIRAKLARIRANDAVADAWNGFVDSLERSRSADDYPHSLPELERIIREAKGSPHDETLKKGHAELVRCIYRRAEEVFGFIQEDVKRLSEAGKYGLGVQAWDWFPGVLDLGGEFQRRIGTEKAQTLDAGLKFYADLRDRADKLFAEKQYEEAKLLMLQALEIGLKETAEEAYNRITTISAAEDVNARRREEEDLKKFEELAKTEREAGQRIAALRTSFWQLVTERRLDTADLLLKREKGQAELAKEVELLNAALGDLRSAFDAAAGWLKSKQGETLSLSLIQNGKPVVRTMRLKDVTGGRLIFSVEGRDVEAAVTDLAPSEFDKVAEAQSSDEAKAWLRGVASLLLEDFERAHTSFDEAKQRGRTLADFIEGSTSFLERNAKLYRDRATKAMEAKEYDRAVTEYSRLASIPRDRRDALRGRSRAYYQVGNFVGCVLDIEQLILMDDTSDEVLSLLAQAYERSSLIAKAIDIFEKARKRKPKNASVLAALMKLYMQIHEFPKARQVLSEAQGISLEVLSLKHLLDIAEEPAFAGQAFKAMWGRYDLETNVSQEYSKEMAFFMDGVYKEYVKVFPYKKNETLRFHVKIFASEGEFQAYYEKVTGRKAAGVYGKVLAYYMPVTKELVGWNAADIKETLRHEGLHQYIDYFVNDCPIWFNEGFASYFEKSTADEAKFNKMRHDSCRAAMSMRMLPPMKDLLLMSAAKWQGDEKAVFYYGHAWSFIYYLIKSGQRSLLDKYFEEVMSGKTQKQVFDSIFGPGKANLSELESKWRKAVFNEDYEGK